MTISPKQLSETNPGHFGIVSEDPAEQHSPFRTNGISMGKET